MVTPSLSIFPGVAGAPLDVLLAVALPGLEAARHVGGDGALDLARALLAAGDGVIAEGVLLAPRALVALVARHVRRTDAVAGLLVAPRRRGTGALRIERFSLNLSVPDVFTCGEADWYATTVHRGMFMFFLSKLKQNS